MIFKYKKAVIICICAFGFMSCKNESYHPISLLETENASIALTVNSNNNYTVQGGDGQYSVSCDNPDIVLVSMASTVNMQLQTLAVGDAVVTVSDKSNNTLQLRIYVDYAKSKVIIDILDVIIEGDLTDEEKEVIRTEALRTIPVQSGGGYLLVYNNQSYNNGTVMIFPDKFGVDGIESVFEQKYVSDILPNGEEIHTPAVCININGEERIFRLVKLPNYSYFTYCEILTDKLKSEYPKIELAYTVQVLLPQLR